MTIKLPALIAISIMGIGLSACSYGHNDRMRPGSYEHHESSTDRYGTRIERSTSTEVNEGRDGRRNATVTSRTTRDPRGMFNKSSTSETREINEPRR